MLKLKLSICRLTHLLFVACEGQGREVRFQAAQLQDPCPKAAMLSSALDHPLQQITNLSLQCKEKLLDGR